jgi:hypothetical protein
MPLSKTVNTHAYCNNVATFFCVSMKIAALSPYAEEVRNLQASKQKLFGESFGFNMDKIGFNQQLRINRLKVKRN